MFITKIFHWLVKKMEKKRVGKLIRRIGTTKVKDISNGNKHSRKGRIFTLRVSGGDSVFYARKYKESLGMATEQWCKNLKSGKDCLIDVQGLSLGQQFEVARVIRKAIRDPNLLQNIVVYDGPYEKSAMLVEDLIKGV